MKAQFRFIIGVMLLINIIFLSCRSEKQKDDTELRKEWGMLWSTPDDSLTNKQKTEKLRLTKFLFEDIRIQDSILVSQLNREDFIKQGFPEKYYDFYMEDIRGINDLGRRQMREDFLDSLPAIKEFILQKVGTFSGSE